MMLWETKSTATGNYTQMKTPSEYNISMEDLDSNSYRSVANGNLVRHIIGKKWLSAKMSFNYLTEQELETIAQALNYNPMYVRIKSPLFGSNGVWEGQMYCSKFTTEMQRNGESATWTNLSFTLVQSKKVSGQ